MLRAEVYARALRASQNRKENSVQRAGSIILPPPSKVESDFLARGYTFCCCIVQGVFLVFGENQLYKSRPPSARTTWAWLISNYKLPPRDFFSLNAERASHSTGINIVRIWGSIPMKAQEALVMPQIAVTSLRPSAKIYTWNFEVLKYSALVLRSMWMSSTLVLFAAFSFPRVSLYGSLIIIVIGSSYCNNQILRSAGHVAPMPMSQVSRQLLTTIFYWWVGVARRRRCFPTEASPRILVNWISIARSRPKRRHMRHRIKIRQLTVSNTIIQ
jgi:hypothetical protein